MSKSPSLRRIQADIRELALDPSDRYHAAPLEDDMFEWHFTIRGADGTDFEGGVYHGRILLPPEYPFKPPNIVFLTPSGRFETGTKVCLSFSAYHPELWQPAWGIRLILEALISFLPTPADGAIGALDWSSIERKRLAAKSVDYCCPRCGKAVALLPKLKSTTSKSEGSASSRFQKEIERLHQLQWEHEGKKNTEGAATAPATEAAEGKEQGSTAEKSDADIKDDKEDSSLKEKDDNDNEVKVGSIETSTSDATTEETKPEALQKPNIPEFATESTGTGPTSVATTPAPAVATAADATTTTTTPEVVMNAPTTGAAPANSEQSWLVDPVLHCTVALLAVICFLLIRKGQALYEEIRRMDSN